MCRIRTLLTILYLVYNFVWTIIIHSLPYYLVADSEEIHINFMFVSDIARPDENFVQKNILMAAGDEESSDGYKAKVEKIMAAVKKALKRECGLSEAAKNDFFSADVREDDTGIGIDTERQKPAVDDHRRFSTRAVLKKTLLSSAATTHCSAVVQVVLLFYLFLLFPS